MRRGGAPRRSPLISLVGWARHVDCGSGVDALSPTAHALIARVCPGGQVVDATVLLAGVMLTKKPEEIERLAELCRFVTAAAEEGLRHGRPALVEALGGAFPVVFPYVPDPPSGWPFVGRE